MLALRDALRSTSPMTCARTSRSDLRVERRLLAGEIADLIDLDLLGQILGDLGLRAAQDEGVDRGAEALRRLVSRRRSIGRAKRSSNLSSGPSRPGRHEVEDRPDLARAGSRSACR